MKKSDETIFERIIYTLTNIIIGLAVMVTIPFILLISIIIQILQSIGG